MVTVTKDDMYKIAFLFDGWDETMIWTCLQGVMGKAWADSLGKPVSTQIITADFCFLAGIPDEELVKNCAGKIVTSKDASWFEMIESVWKGNARKACRYAIKKEPDVFDREKLAFYVSNIPEQFELAFINEEIYNELLKEEWSEDFCSNYDSYDDFNRRGLGIAALYEGRPVSGASSYIVYNGGIEIEIDTKPDFRRKGLATACGSKLILECLSRNLYPSWDAYDLRSVACAEKLGYHMSHEYTVYNIER
ncbi:MAG: GNAT family N-acetyltransferase [Clostridia bacterium]